MEEQWWLDGIYLRDLVDPEGDPGDYTGMIYYHNNGEAANLEKVVEYLMARRYGFPFKFKAVPPPAPRNARMVLLVSPIEDAFWRSHERLRLRPLAGLVRQYKVGPYRLDFALPRQAIGIELDGHRTHSTTKAIAADRQRQRWFEANGWYIIRFGGLEIYQDADACVCEAAHLVHQHRRRRR